MRPAISTAPFPHKPLKTCKVICDDLGLALGKAFDEHARVNGIKPVEDLLLRHLEKDSWANRR
jgi:hypothetical protein